MKSALTRFLIAAAICCAVASALFAQARGRGGAAANAKTSAPVDLTGYWVSVVSEDWRHRIETPKHGDYESVPLNQAGTRAADAWDLAKDDAAGLQCKAFGVGGIMRQPTRLHITWQDDNTLKMDIDAGTQTRLMNFDSSKQATGEKTWQGFSTAQWEGPGVGRGAAAVRAQIGNSSGPIAPGGGGRGQRGGPALAESISRGGSLKVVTTNFKEGYLRKNGVPYSDAASITEYIHRLPSDPGEPVWLLVITVVDDPKYLMQPFYTSTQFKLEPDGSKWAPTPCKTPAPPK